MTNKYYGFIIAGSQSFFSKPFFFVWIKEQYVARYKLGYEYGRPYGWLADGLP